MAHNGAIRRIVVVVGDLEYCPGDCSSIIVDGCLLFPVLL